MDRPLGTVNSIYRGTVGFANGRPFAVHPERADTPESGELRF